MIRRQDHLLQDPMVRFDFNKGTLANEHIEFYRSRGQQKQKLWCQKLDAHTAEADWKECSFAMWVGRNSLNWKCFLSQLNSRVKMTVVDAVLSLGHFRATDSWGCTPGAVCARCPGPGRGSGPFAVSLFRTRGRARQRLCREVSPDGASLSAAEHPQLLPGDQNPSSAARSSELSSFSTNFFDC